jgi:hypothetical protein
MSSVSFLIFPLHFPLYIPLPFAGKALTVSYCVYRHVWPIKYLIVGVFRDLFLILNNKYHFVYKITYISQKTLINRLISEQL